MTRLRLVGLLITSLGALPAQTPPGLAVLETKCLACHSGKFKKAGLDLSTREGLLKGGDHGAAVSPGKSAESLLYKVAAHLQEPHMPFGSPKLKEDEIAAIRSWIDAGTPFSKTLEAAAPPSLTSSHWAFQNPVRPPVPSPKNVSWRGNPIDAFIAAEHEKRNLTPLPEANRRTLLRRAYLDLIGVPPTREALRAFLADPAKDAYEKAVQRLLNDPRYGERWARHWMDIWRYSDWYGWRKGKDVRNSQRFMWRWRDWIVESLNADKGYDRMIVEMLAGDEVAPNDPNTLRATGFLARNFSKYDRHGWMQDAVDHTAMAFLGVTLKCARCHDHKYDPFTQEDYYQFRAVFEPYQVRTDRVPGQTDVEKDGVSRVFDEDLNADTHFLIRGDITAPDKDRKMVPSVPAVFHASLKPQPVPLSLEAYYPDSRAFVHADLIADAKKAIADAEAEVKTKPGPLAEKALAAAQAALPAIEARIKAERAKQDNSPDAETLAEAARKAERRAGVLKADENIFRAHLELTEALAKGAEEKKVAEAQKRVTAAQEALKQAPEGFTPIGKSYPEKSSGRRLALARWIASRQSPLTARVAVNHIWRRHFGRALVPSVAEFGKNGKAPSHPALLDWLAVELMENGWSMKHVHRLMLTSKAYQMQSSAGVAESPNTKTDPENVFLWRMNPRRMEAEIVRDSVLAVSGSLDPTLGGPEIDQEKAQESNRRSLYLQHTPDVPVQFLKTFDSPNPAECYERSESVVPHQALAMANSKLSRDQARVLAFRLSKEGGPFVPNAFETVLGRLPSQAELTAADRFLSSQSNTAREDFIHVLLNHNDFVTIR